MRILLGKCPRAYTSHFESNSESLALGYLCAVLRADGRHQVEILDACLTRRPLVDMVDRVAATNFRLIGFTICDSTYLESTFECVRQLRERGVTSHIILGGYSPTFQYREVLLACPGIDSVALFEGEETIVEIARVLDSGGDWKSVPGLAFRDDHSIITSPPRRGGPDLEALPFPARDNVPHLLQNMPDTGVIAVSGSRGCYADCSFCSIRAFHRAQEGPPIRLRSAANVAREIKELVDRFGTKGVLLVDDVFILPGPGGLKRLSEFEEEFERLKLRVMLSVSERVNNITGPMFTRLRRLGVRQVLVGLEAGSDDLLEYYNKRATCEQGREAIRVLQSLEIDPMVSFINFSPATNLEHLRANLRFLLSLGVNFLPGLLNRFQIYPGTPLGDSWLKDPRLLGSFPKYDYLSNDPRADLVYRIAHQSLGLFLTTAFVLMRLERRLRLLLFDAELQGRGIVPLLKARKQFRQVQQTIMEDAAAIFSQILDFVESYPKADGAAIERFVTGVRETVRRESRGWWNRVTFFSECCPALKTQNGPGVEGLIAGWPLSKEHSDAERPDGL